MSGREDRLVSGKDRLASAEDRVVSGKDRLVSGKDRPCLLYTSDAPTTASV